MLKTGKRDKRPLFCAVFALCLVNGLFGRPLNEDLLLTRAHTRGAQKSPHKRQVSSTKVIMAQILEANAKVDGGEKTSTFSKSDPAEEEVKLFQGDIIMTPQISEALNNSINDSIVLSHIRFNVPGPVMNRKRIARAITNTTDMKWPVIGGKAEVPYVIEESCLDAKSVIEEAMSHWTINVPCITFVPRTDQSDYLSFFAGKGCYSDVGRIGRKQRISIGADCKIMGIVAHEIAHALGFWHEQSRPDRDEHVNVLWDNIEEGKSDEFKKILGGAIDSKGIPYDINSLMHFGPHAFAKAEGYNTLETLTGKTDFGQRNGLSTLDIEQAKLLYCTDGCQHVDKVPECQYYKSQGYCNQGSGYESYMETQCKRSCLCNVCEDTDANCSEFVRQGFCTNPEYSVHMNAYCKKSCNLCT